MTLDDFKDMIAEQLFTPQGARHVLQTNDVPDYDANELGISADAIEGIVVPTIESHGYWPIDPVSTIKDGLRLFGRVEPSGECLFLFVRWEPADQALPEGAFNPYTHIELAAVPPADIKYLQGRTPGVRQ